MTYGDIKFRLTKAFDGVDADLLEGWITDTYLEILGALPWSRLDTQSILVTTAPYTTGTVAVTNGSPSVVLTGGAFSSGMNGLAFHINGDSEEYQFTYSSGSAGTLDRNYSGTTNAAASYSIYQSVYPLPASCRFLDDGAFNSFEAGPIRRVSIEIGQREIAVANGYPPFNPSGVPYTGVPRMWWPYMDDGSTPPNIQVRFFPIPDKVYGIPYTYCAEASIPSGTSFTLLPWLQPAALIEGATAKIKRHLKDYTGAEVHAKAYGDAVRIMSAEEAYRRGPMQMQMGSYYTRHRVSRGR